MDEIQVLTIVNKIGVMLDIEMLEVTLFERDPFFFESGEPFLAVSSLDADELLRIGDSEKDGLGVGSAKFRVVAVGALHDKKGTGRDAHRVAEGHSGAVESPIGEGLACAEMGCDLGEKTLVVDVAADLGEAFCGALLGAKKEIVHVNDGGVEASGKCGGKGGLARGGTAVNGDGHGTAACEGFLDEREKRIVWHEKLRFFFIVAKKHEDVK